MRNKLAMLFAGLLATVGIALAVPQHPAEASPWAYTYIHYNYQGLNRVINVRCHSNGVWKAMRQGQYSNQVCPGDNGWVTYVWVDSDVNLCGKKYGTSNYQYWGSGQMYAVPGSWHVYVTKGGCV